MPFGQPTGTTRPNRQRHTSSIAPNVLEAAMKNRAPSVLRARCRLGNAIAATACAPPAASQLSYRHLSIHPAPQRAQHCPSSRTAASALSPLPQRAHRPSVLSLSAHRTHHTLTMPDTPSPSAPASKHSISASQERRAHKQCIGTFAPRCAQPALAACQVVPRVKRAVDWQHGMRAQDEGVSEDSEDENILAADGFAALNM
ncbi:hypothetical protein FA95DRAFT_1613044 [Auriscalpium vulgare]|uniref:Uncharacterized protein n=1 Tax=Auriscalpium vulgare TaxID=40419 RepID=A0ACB8R4K3_9AGAM|nr:hypothetical protein FA95DRAFT_1613044 [Auriscalpium vulgare]